MIEVLVNDVTLEGMRRVKVVSDAPLSPSTVTSPQIPFGIFGESVRQWSDDLLGLHYLEAVWPCREPVSIRVGEWKCARKMVLWKLEKGERVSEALMCALGAFGAQFKCFPDYAFMKKMPRGIESGFEVNDVMFIEAEWVPAGCIAVCKGDEPPSGFAHFPQIAAPQSHAGQANAI